MLIGYPGSGKTTFYEQELKTHGYERITSTAQDLNPTKRYVIEKRSLSSSIGRDHALQQARRAHLPVRLLRIDPPGDSPNGAWRQLVWRHHCEKQAQAPPSDAGHAFFNRAARREPLMSARDFAQACKTYSCPHPKSEEAALYQNGVEEVPWSYRGDPEEKERYFRVRPCNRTASRFIQRFHRYGPKREKRRTKILNISWTDWFAGRSSHSSNHVDVNMLESAPRQRNRRPALAPARFGVHKGPQNVQFNVRNLFELVKAGQDVLGNSVNVWKLIDDRPSNLLSCF